MTSNGNQGRDLDPVLAPANRLRRRGQRFRWPVPVWWAWEDLNLQLGKKVLTQSTARARGGLALADEVLKLVPAGGR